MRSVSNKICLIILLLFTISCKRYPDDPFYSLRTSKQRLKGNWKIDKILIDGIDVSNNYNDTLAPNAYSDFVFDFRFDLDIALSGNKEDYVFVNKSIVKSSLDNFDIAIWGMDNDQKDKELYFFQTQELSKIKDSQMNTKLTNLFYLKYNGWNIQKLWKKSLHIKSTKNNQVYEVFFRKL